VIRAFGVEVEVIVTPPGGAPVSTSGVWLPPRSLDNLAEGSFQRAEQKRVFCLPLDGLPAVPRGTIVSAPESKGAAVANWRVDEAERVDFDHYRAVVMKV